MNTKYLYINTIGCQMNVYDSEQIAKGLKTLRYKMTSSLRLVHRAHGKTPYEIFHVLVFILSLENGEDI